MICVFFEQKATEKYKLKYDLGRLLNGQSDYLFLTYEDFFTKQSHDNLALLVKRLYAYNKTGKEPDYSEESLIFYYWIAKTNSNHCPISMNKTLFDKIINFIEPKFLWK